MNSERPGSTTLGSNDTVPAASVPGHHARRKVSGKGEGRSNDQVSYLHEPEAGAEAVNQVGVDQESINIAQQAGDSLYSFLALSVRLKSYSLHKNKAAPQEIMTDNGPHWQQPSTRRQP